MGALNDSCSIIRQHLPSDQTSATVAIVIMGEALPREDEQADRHDGHASDKAVHGGVVFAGLYRRR